MKIQPESICDSCAQFQNCHTDPFPRIVSGQDTLLLKWNPIKKSTPGTLPYERNCIQWNGKSLSANTACMTSVLTFKRLRAGNDSAFLTGCHSNQFRHKDHFCVRAVLACSAPQAAPVHCVKLSQIPRLVKYYFNRPTRPSRWTFLPAAKRENMTPLPRFLGEIVWLFQSPAFTNENVLSVMKDDLLKTALLGSGISTSEVSSAKTLQLWAKS